MLSNSKINLIEKLKQQGCDCLKQKQAQQALLYFNRIILLSPENIEILEACAKVLTDLDRPSEAIVYSERALQISVTCNLLKLHAQSLYKIGYYLDAIACFDKILIEEPNNYSVMAQKALCLTQINHYDEASKLYQKAIEYSKHQDINIQFNYSLCLLAMGELLSGFKLFEYRWSTASSEENHNWKFPEAISPDILQKKTILIHSEQGLGDSIQFFRYVPVLIGLGAKVFLEIQPSLIPLFYAWHPTITFIAKGAPLPKCDYHCPMMSLARLFKTEIGTIPQSIPYLFPALPFVEICQKKLAHIKKLRVGIAWKGSKLNQMNQKRSIMLDTLLTIHQDNCSFICLQKDVYLNEKKELDKCNIPYHSLELSTMAGTAALIACLDLVITIDTSIAHMAAAQGKEVWILLPMGADWRWFTNREDSPWYPNVKLFRQEKLNDWSTPLNNIKKSLLTFKSNISEDNLEKSLEKAKRELQNGLPLASEKTYRHILIHYPRCDVAALNIALAALAKNNLADAIQFMQQAVIIAPKIDFYRRNLGELLRRACQLDAAISSHQMAINIDPKSAENHFQLALAYNDNQQFELAIQHYHTALSFNKNHGMAWNNLGASLEAIGDTKKAKDAYKNAISLNEKHVEAQNNLGAIYSAEGQITKACKHFEAAITANMSFIEAHYNLSLLKKYTLDDPHLIFLESIQKEIARYSIYAQIHYFFAFGKALDDTKQYTRAFQAYAKGNSLYHSQRPWNKTTLEEIVKQIPSIFTKSFLKPPKENMEKRCPIFIVGMPRSGTTLIEQILASHKNIYGAGELKILDEIIQDAHKTSNLPFTTWISQLTDDEFQILGKKYLDKTWELAPDKNFIIDKMPGNSFYVGMIYRMLPNAKVIHAMRDPMDSCFSCFTHLFKDTMLFAYDLQTLGHYYQLYIQTMLYWQTVLPKTFIFDLPYEQMVADHELYSKKLLAFIGLAWDPNCLYFYKNNRAVKTASLTQVRKPIYKSSLARWKNFAKELQPLLEIVAPYRNEQGYTPNINDTKLLESQME